MGAAMRGLERHLQISNGMTTWQQTRLRWKAELVAGPVLFQSANRSHIAENLGAFRAGPFHFDRLKTAELLELAMVHFGPSERLRDPSTKTGTGTQERPHTCVQEAEAATARVLRELSRIRGLTDWPSQEEEKEEEEGKTACFFPFPCH